MVRVDKPVQVRRAVTLLWVSLIAGIVTASMDTEWSVFAEMDGFTWPLLAVFCFTYALFAGLIVLVSRRHNWARISILILTVIGVLVMLIPWPGLDDQYWTLSTATSQLGLVILDGLALFWLFTGAGAAWFAPKARTPGH